MEKKKKKKKESFEKRSPLQHLNPPQFHTPITKNISNPSSSSVSFEAPKALFAEIQEVPASMPWPRQCARTTTKPNCRNPRIPNLSSGKGNPGRKIGGGRGLDSVNSDGHENVGKESISETATGDSATSLKTPPVEASVSPEIPCGFQSKMSFPESSATPVCYGAGHLLSGVTDKRKCRRRGSFKGGSEKTNLFYDGKNDRNVVCDSQDSSIPLLAEASVRWLLSPCDEGCEDLRSDSENSGSGSVGGAASKREDEILVLSPGKNPELGCSEEKMHEHLLITTPNSTSNCNAISAGEEKNFRHNVIENDCALSLGSLSGGNIIQTPNSDSSIDGCSGRTKDRCELFLITETLNKVGLSPRSEMSISDAPGFSFQYADMDSSSSSINLNHIQENIDTVCSWVSDSTLENLALSHVRISWRDGLVNRIDENDEFDSCRCLSDEEVDADGFSYTKLSSSPVSQSRRGRETDEEMKSCLGSHLGDESGANEGNDLGIDNDALPLLLSYEPCISALGKEKRLPNNAESIC
ncbi:UNVERIFIED_CONTAM: hypothetical protein Scaly_0486900 [Sesamum calycinum]|uniref:Uncharacterized protein n=1 Tax=Sesamum calycinum TaxID=2727403 RepID=A0AAW2RP78_9LAMI